MRRNCFALVLAVVVIMSVSVGSVLCASLNAGVTFDKSCYSPGDSGRATIVLENQNAEVWIVSASMNITGLGIFEADMGPLMANNTVANPYAYLLAANSSVDLGVPLSIPANATAGEHEYAATIVIGHNTPGMMTPPSIDPPITEQGSVQVCSSTGPLSLTPGTPMLLIAAVGGAIGAVVIVFLLVRSRRKACLPSTNN